MTDDRKQSKNTPDDPWARFDDLDREASSGARDLDPLEDDLGEDEWELDDGFEGDDDELDDDELFDDEVEPAAPRDALLAETPLRASKADDDLDFGADDSDEDLEFDEDEYLDDDELGEDDADGGYPAEAPANYRAAADVLQPRPPADPRLAMASAAAATASAGLSERSSENRRVTKPPRNLPWIPLVAGIVAIVLVLAGGFGMVQQRNELQAEIRELRARLATAPSADALAQAKTEQEALRTQNAELSTAYSALQQEAERLQSAIGELRAAQEAAQKTAQVARAALAKPAATQTNTPQAATPTNGSWFVNFAAYQDEATAKRWADRLKVSGGKVEVQRITSDGRPLYRVRVSQIASRSDATRIARALEQEHNVSSLWVGQQ